MDQSQLLQLYTFQGVKPIYPSKMLSIITYLAQVKTIAVDFVNDDETTYRLKIAREIEGKSEIS